MNKYVLRIKGKSRGLGKEITKIVSYKEFSDPYTAIEEFTKKVNRKITDEQFEKLEVHIDLVLPIFTFKVPVSSIKEET